MQTVQEYIDSLEGERKEAISKLRTLITTHIPVGYEETISYGMIGWVVPHSTYPDGYHCDPSLPLPFINLASQKSHIGLYHMGIYADENLLKWFEAEYPKHCSTKLNMGKSCIRFKNVKKIPYDLIVELVGKVTPEQWIAQYEKSIKRK